MMKSALQTKDIVYAQSRNILPFWALWLAVSIITPVYADTGVDDMTVESQPFTVSATIASGCILGNGTTDISTFGDLDFGLISSLGTPTNISSNASAGSIVLKCSNGTPVTIAIDAGLHASGNITNGRMLKNTATTELLTYQLYQDAAYSQIWGNDANGGAVNQLTTDGSIQEIKIYASLFSVDQRPSAGQYTDTVTVTVTY